jgi:hypothetical protein
MFQTPGRPRTFSAVPDSFNLRLEHYLLAATAASVSVLALTHPAGAEIVYTPANLTILPGQNCALDLNHDGVGDFVLHDVLYNGSSGHAFTLSIRAQATGNVAMAFTSDDGFVQDAAALRAGAHIAPATGAPSALLAAFYTSFAGNHFLSGRWVNIQNHYLGLKFQIDGATHFGWARLSVHVNSDDLKAYLTGYAYETVAGKAITAGQTLGPAEDAKLDLRNHDDPQLPALGMLALGVQGLPRTRRNRV